jgi:Family of unknown function (DUF5947)
MSGAPGLRRFVRPEAGPAAGATVTPGPPVTNNGATGLPAPLAERLSPDRAAADAGDQAERCELCAADVPAEHGHVADLESSTLVCACRACYLLFTQSNAMQGRYRAIPDRYVSDPGRVPTPAQWDALEIPVGLAFFLTAVAAGVAGAAGEERVTAFYPSPAGATECILDLAAWQQLTQEYPLLGAAAPDVEAVLISRGDAGVECFVVPVDACYELAGRMRLQWRGFDGGTEARASIAEFLDRVRSRARLLSQEA